MGKRKKVQKKKMYKKEKSKYMYRFCKTGNEIIKQGHIDIKCDQSIIYNLHQFFDSSYVGVYGKNCNLGYATYSLGNSEKNLDLDNILLNDDENKSEKNNNINIVLMNELGLMYRAKNNKFIKDEMERTKKEFKNLNKNKNDIIISCGCISDDKNFKKIYENQYLPVVNLSSSRFIPDTPNMQWYPIDWIKKYVYVENNLGTKKNLEWIDEAEYNRRYNLLLPSQKDKYKIISEKKILDCTNYDNTKTIPMLQKELKNITSILNSNNIYYLNTNDNSISKNDTLIDRNEIMNEMLFCNFNSNVPINRDYIDGNRNIIKKGTIQPIKDVLSNPALKGYEKNIFIGDYYDPEHIDTTTFDRNGYQCNIYFKNKDNKFVEKKVASVSVSVNNPKLVNANETIKKETEHFDQGFLEFEDE